jgi:hypothetical protein
MAMNVVTFYLFIGAVLGSVYLFFKPMKVDVAEPGELAQIELDRFIVHEVVPKGVKTIMTGSHALRFTDRYVVSDLNLTDRSEGHTENMRAKSGTYREPMILLRKDVRYRRDDGIRFETDSVDYNRSSGQMVAPGPFVLWQAHDRITGRDLIYNTKRGEISAEKIVGNYFLKEKQ